VNRAQKKEYLKDYAQAKAEGKPFFPYAIYKDHLVAILAIGIVILLAVVYRVEVGEPVNPASTDYVPRPEWYFFFLFELLKIFKGDNLLTPVIMGSFIVPNILIVLLLIWPFLDPGPERRIDRRPISMAVAVVVVALLAFLTHEGSKAPVGAQSGPVLEGLDETGEAGLAVYSANGCASCHMIGGVGATGPGPNLTNESEKDRGIEWQIGHLKAPSEFTPGSAMPAYANLPDEDLQSLAVFLEGLGETYIAE
jgi:mono/diheme cytochrome c family protein